MTSRTIKRLLARQPTLASAIGPVLATGAAWLVTCQDLSVHVLPGRMHVVAERSGSGKTSVLGVAERANHGPRAHDLHLIDAADSTTDIEN